MRQLDGAVRWRPMTYRHRVDDGRAGPFCGDYTVMAYIVMAYILMAYIGMAYIVMVGLGHGTLLWGSP